MDHGQQLTELFREALCHQRQGNRSGALLAYRRLQRRFPGFADGWTNGSVVLFEMGRFDEALVAAQTAAALDPESPAAHCACASALNGLGLVDDAAAAFGRAVLLDPAHFPALTNLAGIHARRGNFDEALGLEDRAIEACPSHSALWGNRGHTKMRMLDLRGAEEDLLKALELDAGNHQVRWNLAYVQMLQGRLGEVWPNFRARLHLDEWSGNRQDFGRPHWNGEALEGRTLLVYTEQGFGDAIQFSRFVPRLRRFGGRVLLQVYRSLERLLAHLPGIDGLAVEGGPLPHFDLVVPQMELPAILDVGPEGLAPLPPPQLPDCPPLPELARPGFRVGLAWAGSESTASRAARDMDPAFFGGLAGMPGVAWYGLQKDAGPQAPPLPGFTDLSPRMGDFMDTAQLVGQLDMVATVDTSMAHLAGTLGVPTVVLLSHMSDWRWGLGRATPWYPSSTLLRQASHGDWGR